MIFQPNLSFTYFFVVVVTVRSLNNNLSLCLFVVIIVFLSFVHHKSLRYELNHLIAIIRLSQLVIGIDDHICLFSLSVFICVWTCVINFLYFYFICF